MMDFSASMEGFMYRMSMTSDSTFYMRDMITRPLEILVRPRLLPWSSGPTPLQNSEDLYCTFANLAPFVVGQKPLSISHMKCSSSCPYLRNHGIPFRWISLSNSLRAPVLLRSSWLLIGL